MEFNFLSRFDDLKKKDQKSEGENLYFQYVVVGNDIFSIAKFLELREKHDNKVTLICDFELKKETLIPRGPTTLRGSQNTELFKKLYPGIELEEQKAEPVFFKEKEWRSFSGRMKSEKLLYQEEFFSQKGFSFDLRKLFPFIDQQDLFEQLNEQRLKASIKGIVRHQPPFDLVQPARFSVQLSDGKNINCENIFWGLGPVNYIHQFTDPSQLSDGFIQYAETIQTPAMLVVAFKLNDVVSEMDSTMFIPLSYTHEWGHFIGEFIKRDNENWAEFICFVDPEHSSEQDLVKKIHLLKRNLDKIFENFSEKYTQEQVLFIANSPCLKIDDFEYESFVSKEEGLFFVSYNAPFGDFDFGLDNFEYSDIPFSFFSRGVSSLRIER